MKRAVVFVAVLACGGQSVAQHGDVPRAASAPARHVQGWRGPPVPFRRQDEDSTVAANSAAAVSLASATEEIDSKDTATEARAAKPPVSNGAEAKPSSSVNKTATGAAEKPLALAPPSRGSVEQPGQQGSAKTPRAAVATVATSLAAVVGLFLLLVWCTRRAAPKGAGPLPDDVLHSLGRAPLTAKQHLQLVRVGNKLLLLCVTAEGAETLTEIDDPAEVERLCGLCRVNDPNSISATFRQVLHGLSRDGGDAPLSRTPSGSTRASFQSTA